MPTQLTDIENVRSGIDAALQEDSEALGLDLARVGSPAATLRGAQDALTSGGKRLRAAFCYWSWRAHGGAADAAERPVVVRVGAALELFQASALFHDDVMDASATRRGRPTAHVAFAATHRDAGWSGDATRFGENVAILLGDLSLIASHRLLARALTGTSPEVGRTATEIFGRMQTEVIAGQYLDVVAQAVPFDEDGTAPEERAWEVLRAKTVGYSVAHPLALGAALAGTDPAGVSATASFGVPVGEAFQLRDDVLGVFGDTAVTGKPAGDDLREGKRTVLVCRAYAAATASARERIVTLLGDPDLDEDGVATLRSILVETGALASVERTIDDLAASATEALAARGWDEPGTTMLRDLARAAIDRTS